MSTRLLPHVQAIFVRSWRAAPLLPLGTGAFDAPGLAGRPLHKFESDAMYLRPLFVIALCLVSISHSLAAEPTPVQLEGFQCTGTPLSIKLPAGLTQLQKMAPLQKQEVIRTEQWDGYQTTEIDLHFVGLAIGAITFTNDHERYNLVSARVSRAAWAVSPFRIGGRAEPSLRRLGVTGDVSNGTWRIEELTDALVLEVRAGRISGVLYDCYIG